MSSAVLLAAPGCVSIGNRSGERALFPPSACKAEQYHGFIGAPLAATTLPVGVRVIEPGAILTQDYVPTRLNALVDARGSITGFRCG
ncbi:I78 family peptidase inhibitor [Sphingomonas sp.]|uniref:I78 family peptidase inhibitor n=1 Tax=Sphingomonas sp. TaxID=28214 RepID=UPI0025D2ADD1|nr:I78 family peptidase inhibitor [Sphingomonas sp.]